MKRANGEQPVFRNEGHIGVDIASGLVHTVATTPPKCEGLNMAGRLPRGEGDAAPGDADYQGVHAGRSRGPDLACGDAPGPAAQAQPVHRAGLRGGARGEDEGPHPGQVEHPFRVLKRQFGFSKVRYRGLAENTARIVTLSALGNLWLARRALLGAG